MRSGTSFFGSSGISGKRRMDRGGTDRQSTTLMKTRTTRDTTDKAPRKKVLPEFAGNAAWKGQRKQTNDCEAGGTGRVRLTKTRTKPDTTATARITSKDVVLSC